MSPNGPIEPSAAARAGPAGPAIGCGAATGEARLDRLVRLT